MSDLPPLHPEDPLRDATVHTFRVIGYAPTRPYGNGNHRRYVVIRCEACGVESRLRRGTFHRGEVKPCRCTDDPFSTTGDEARRARARAAAGWRG